MRRKKNGILIESKNTKNNKRSSDERKVRTRKKENNNLRNTVVSTSISLLEGTCGLVYTDHFALQELMWQHGRLGEPKASPFGEGGTIQAEKQQQ